MGWLGIVEAPDGIAGVSLGSFGILTANLVIMSTATEDRNAGSSEGSLDDQRLFANSDVSSILTTSLNQVADSIGIGILGTVPFADQLGVDGDSSFPSDSHAIQSGKDASLLPGEGSTVGNIIVDHDAADQSKIDKSRSVIDGLSVLVSDVDVSRDLASPGGNGTSTDLQLLDLDKLALQSFPAFSGFRGEASGSIEANLLIAFGGASDLAQSEDQQDQNALQHSLSFGSLTLPPDRKSVNQYAI